MKRPDWKTWMRDKNECKQWFERYLKNKILMKTDNESSLHIKKSNHDLNLANWLFQKHKHEIKETFGEENFYDWIISMYYYAIYHAALAILSMDGYKSKNHSATLCFLILRHYHEKEMLKEEELKLIANTINREDIETIGFSKELREKASYDVHETFEEELAENTRIQAVNLINKTKNIIEG